MFFQMSGLGGDNMTVILVCFLHKKPYETLIEKCKAAIEAKSNESTNQTRTAEDVTIDDAEMDMK